MKPYPDGAIPAPDLPFDEEGDGDYYSPQPSSPEPEEDENEENEDPKRFEKGDRVRVNDLWEDGDEHLQKDNRVGTVIDIDSEDSYWLHMDKPVIDEGDGEERPSIIPDGHAYYAVFSELELIEAATESRESFSIEEWRENLKPGDRVRVTKDPQKIKSTQAQFVSSMDGWKGCVVILKEKCKHSSEVWTIQEDKELWNFDRRWFEPVERTELSKPQKAKELKKQPPDPRLKNLTQTALGIIQDIEKAFRDSQKYPIFGMNLAKQEPEEKNQSSRLNDCLSSLGVVLYHLFTGESEHNNHSYLLDGYSKPEDMAEGFWKVVNKLLKSEYKDLDELKEDLKSFKDGG